MANPNLLSLTTVNAKSAVQAATTSATAIVTNSASSGTLIKVTALFLTNISALTKAATIDVYRSSTAYNILKDVDIPAGSSIDVVSKTIYLEEGDSLRITAAENSTIHAVCSYEVLS